MNDDNSSGKPFLSVGCGAVVEIAMHGGRIHHFKTTVLGWHEHDYILLEWPKTSAERKPVQENTPCIIRTLHDGVIAGFSTTITDRGLPGLRQMRVEWPKEIKTLYLRKHERVAVRTACKVILKNDRCLDVLMVDIAVGGCSIEGDLDLARNEEVTVTIPFSGPGVPDRIRAVVRNLAPVNAGIRAGLQFPAMDEAATFCLEFAITHRLQEARTKLEQRIQVLVFEREDVSRETAVNAIRSMGICAERCNTLVEGFYFILAIKPRAVIIADSLCALSELDVCRLVAETRGCEDICLFAKNARAGQQASDMGSQIQYYSDSAELADSLREICVARMPERPQEPAGDEFRLHEAVFHPLHAMHDAPE